MATTLNTSTVNTKKETQKLEVFDNTSEFVVKINESKARLVYIRYFKSTSGGTVLSFLGTFLSCLVALLTATFNDVFGIEGSAAVLTAIFVLLTIGFGILTVVWGIKWVISLFELNEDSFIKELKGDNKTPSKSSNKIKSVKQNDN